MESEHGSTDGKKHDQFTEEVVYVATENTKRDSQYLKFEDGEKHNDSCFLYLSAFTADLLAFASGCGMAWSSPAFATLTESNPYVNPLGQPVTPIQQSWIVALLFLGAAIGPIITAKLADSLGRKKVLLLVSLPMIVGNITLAFARSVNLFYIARFVLGLGVGGTFAILPLYLGEITENHNRGKFGCIMAVFVTSGLLYPFIIGHMTSLKVFSFSCAIPLMLFLIFFSLFCPDSPIFLLNSDRKKEAKEVLIKVRNKSYSQVESEIKIISQELEKNKASKGGIGDFCKVLSLRRGLTVSLGLIILQQLSGVNAVMGFMGQIFIDSGSEMSTYVSSVLVGIVQVVATVLTSSIVERLGRKLLLLVSTAGSSASILILGLYFYLKKSNIYNTDSLYWLPVTCLIAYIISINMGLGPLPWTIMGEIFPSNIKFLAASLTTFVCFFGGFLVTLGFPILAENFGMTQCFWLFGSCCALGIIFIYCIVPETKGKTLTEIQEILGKK